MNLLICLIFFNLISSIAFSGIQVNQSQIDSLENLLKSASGEEKLEIQVQLIKMLTFKKPLRAIGLGQGAKSFLESETNPALIRDMWYYTGIALHKQSEYDSLLTHAKALKDWAKKIGEKKGVNLGLLLEGEYHNFKGNYNEAIILYDKALSGFESENDTLYIAKTLNAKGAIYIEKSDYEDALLAYSSAFSLYDALDLKEGIAAGFSNLGYVYTHKGNFDKANTFYEQALDVLAEENIDDQWLLATILNRMGLNFMNARQFNKCLEAFEKSLKICESNGDKAYMSYVLNNIGKTNLFLGNYDIAISSYRKSLSIMEELDYKLGIAWINHSLAKIYDIRNDDETALELLNRALEIRREIDHKHGIGLTLSHIGSIYAKQNKCDPASEYFAKAYAIFNRIENQLGLVDVLSKQGDLELNQKKYNSADSIFNLVLNEENSIEDQLIIASTLRKKAILKRELGKYASALYYIDRALEKSNILNVGIEKRDNLLVRSTILESLMRYQEALDTYKEYKQINDSLFSQASERDIAILKATYEFEQEKKELLSIKETQELRNIDQAQKIQILRRDQELQQLWLFVLIAGLILFLAITLLVYYLLSNKVKSKNMLLKQEQDLEQMKSDLFLNIAHELRTPMTLILGPLGDLENNVRLTDREKRCFQLIRNNSEKLVNMADEILQASKLGTEEVLVSFEPVPVKQTINLVWSDFQTMADKKSISYRLEVSLEQELWVKTDKGKLEKILSELISNALKYSKSGCIVEVSARISEGQLQITVRDTGSGIDKEEQSQIFNRYYQSKRGEKRKLGGVGLGLSIVKNLVEVLKGSIKVESEVGTGTKFTVLLPTTFAEVERQPEVYSNELIVSEPIISETKAKELPDDKLQLKIDDSIHSQTVLVIEDQPDMLDYICDILEDSYNVLKALNGKQALEMLKQEENFIDLIISDIMMPEMDGLEFLKSIRQDKMTSSVPIIILSAMPEDEPRILSQKGEINDYIKKPFNRALLISRCKKLLDHPKKINEL